MLESYTGTAPYMAPEKNHKQAKSDPSKADIFSFGTMLYQMLYGKLPN